jgi:hypothetical protein
MFLALTSIRLLYVVGVAMLQDILILESSKIFIIFIFAVLSAKPQLQVIKRVINDRALSMVQDGARARARAGARDGSGIRGRSEMSVVQVRYSAVSVVKYPPLKALLSLLFSVHFPYTYTAVLSC